LFFIDSTCDWSDKFFETLKDSDVNSYISDNNYIKYYVNVEKNKDVFFKYKVESTPWYIVIDKNENIIKTGSGYKQKREFLIWLRNIIKNNSK
jgi:thioredoxin-related protein